MPTVRARYVDGALQPLEPLELEDGCEVNLSVDPDPAPPESLTEMFRRIRVAAPLGEEQPLPPDGAKNYKHYLYGFPREEA